MKYYAILDDSKGFLVARGWFGTEVWSLYSADARRFTTKDKAEYVKNNLIGKNYGKHIVELDTRTDILRELLE